MKDEIKNLDEPSVYHMLDATIHVNGSGCWDDLSMTERRNVLETILMTNEIVDMDDCLADMSGEDMRRVLCYFMISKKDSSYRIRMNSHLQSIIDTLLEYIEADVNYYMENTYESVYGIHPDDIKEQLFG